GPRVVAACARRSQTHTAVIARLDGATQYPETFEVNREAAAYWIARSSRATTVLIVVVYRNRHCEERLRRSNPFFLSVALWIAPRSLSSGAHSRDPLARNDVYRDYLISSETQR
ncbi:MAG: hypothetical protein ABIL01_25115, partial [Pseudomonadota bacterium]